MILEFPNLDTLQLALTSGLLPPEVSTAPAAAAIGERGSIWVATTVKVPAEAQKQLERLGVQVARSMGAAEQFRCLSWAQILPLRREAGPGPITPQTPVLFELPSASLLPGLVGEMLRLGNDRQSFRAFDAQGESPAVLLRVIGPPYYTLLQALERDGEQPAPRAYVERAQGVWVELGWTHPLVGMVKPPRGKLLLVRPPREWCLVEEAPLRDIYEILEFPLAHAPVAWREMPDVARLQVPLRLVTGGSDTPELWVLRDNAQEQIEAFVRSTNDQLLSRLAFAVGDQGSNRCIVVRVRPSRQPPPVLVLDAQAFRSYLKLPNLFVPCGQILMPQLRRDAVRRLLAPEADQITWLYPAGDGAFTPESLPESAFRPLTEWVEYVLSNSRAPLQAWLDASQFDFERFICRDDVKPEQKPKETRKGRRPTESIEGDLKGPDVEVKRGERPPEELEPLQMQAQLEPTELQKRQLELEAQFLEIEGSLDAPARQALWPELAGIYTALGNLSDAAASWSNVLWDESAASTRAVRLWHDANLAQQRGRPAGDVLDRILRQAEPAPNDLRLLASFILGGAQGNEPEPALLQRLPLVQDFLRVHDYMLPARLVWLVGLALHRVSGGDVLALARTRDRLLARLFESGLTAEIDLPSFLRFSGSAGHARFRAFRDWLNKLPERVRYWLTNVNPTGSLGVPGETLAYADMILAFGLARLGEKELARTLHARARKELAQRQDARYQSADHHEDVHHCLVAAFGYRIEQALAGVPTTGPLPPDQHEYLEKLDRIPHYIVDKLRQYSRILEPHEKIDPYRSWYRAHRDELSRQLLQLVDIRDPDALAEACRGLLARHAKKDAASRRDRARVLTAAIGLAPRIGETFAVPLLGEVSTALTHLPELLEQAVLLEKALLVAAHFNQVTHVKQFVAHLQQLLRSKDFHQLLHLQALGDNQPILDSLLGQCFPGLRKMGLRDMIGPLLDQLTVAVLEGKSLAAHRGMSDKEWAGSLRALLQVAGGYFYFGMVEQARPILEETRRLLLQRDPDVDFRAEQRKLARAYIAALGQAPVELGVRGIDEMLRHLQGIWDNFHTSRYFGLYQLEIVESVVLAMVTDDFAQGGQARRWLDDDEFLIRQRVHQDMQRALGGS